jgi:hypothetical protein
MDLRTPTYVSANKLPSSGGFLIKELQELFTSNYTVNGYTLKSFYRAYICHGHNPQMYNCTRFKVNNGETLYLWHK